MECTQAPQTTQHTASDKNLISLPPEILTIIGECLFESLEFPERTMHLKNLRLVQRNFAHLRPLCSIVFARVMLRPDPFKFNIDWSTTKIGEHVKEVIFACYLVEDTPATASKLAQVSDFYNSGNAQIATVDALKHFTRHQSVIFEAVHWCEGEQFPPFYDLHQFAVTCLQDANIQLQQLSLIDELDLESHDRRPRPNVLSKPPWQLDIWHDLDLTHLTKLRIESTTDFYDYHPDFSTESTSSLLSALRTCSATLKELRIGSNVACLWSPSSDLPVMANLRSLCLASWCTIIPTQLAAWILRCPMLDECVLYGALPVFDESKLMFTFSDFRPIFHAVREHPSKMLIRICTSFQDPWSAGDEVWEDDCKTIDITHRTDTAAILETAQEKDLEGVSKEDYRKMAEAVLMLKKYMSGVGDWVVPEGATSW